MNVNRAGFTVCLFYGAVGRVELSPSTRAPAQGGGPGALDDDCLDIRL